MNIRSFRAFCVTTDPKLRRTLSRALMGAGARVELVEAAELIAALEERAAQLIVLDGDARRALDLARLAELTGAPVIVAGESPADDEVLALLRARTLNHLVDDPVDDEALVVTSGKVFHGDIFGLEKYLAWGAAVHERTVPSYDEKREALLEVAAFAADIGARRQLVARVESVADELLMNALYDAPALRRGVDHRAAMRGRSPRDAPAILRYGCDGRWIGVSVRDAYGELVKDAILDHVARARAQRGAPQLKPSGGAGLGLHFVISSVARFVANVAPGQLTEVIGLFDVRATGREQETCARSLHVFTTGRIDVDSVTGLTPAGAAE